MIGIVVNTLAILVGGGIGCIFCGKFPVRIQRLILQSIGAVALFLGARSFVGAWFVESTTAMETTGTLLVIFALLVGWVFGEALRLDKLVDALGGLFKSLDKPSPSGSASGKHAKASGAPARKKAIRDAKRAVKNPGASAELTSGRPASKERIRPWEISRLPDHPTMETRSGDRCVDGFAWTTLLCALNAMSFSGAITAGMTGETKELLIKAAVDAVIVLFLAAIYGIGAACGAVSVLAVEGILIFVSAQWPDLMTPTLISHLVIIAAVMTVGAGICLCFGKKWRVVNLIPALLISPIYGLVVNYADKVIKK